MFNLKWSQWWRQTFRLGGGGRKRRGRTIRRQVPSRSLCLEALEDRTLLNGSIPTPVPISTPPYKVFIPQSGPYQFPAPTGYTPAQIQKAYGIDQLYGIIGNGAGQTIALIDSFDDPAFVNSTDPTFNNSDLHKFDVQFGLPDPPSFQKLNQTGGTTLPVTDPKGKGTNNWEGEEALDIEWAHALAPGANIIIYEATSDLITDQYAAAATAANNPAVSVVSMSFGTDEFNGETSFDSTFTTPAGHQGITFLASTGDNGSPGGYAAYSPNVIAVGGTNLQLNADNSYKGETGWGNGANSNTQGGSGGGTSQFEPEPAYQQSVQQTGKRTIPDVAFDADPASGVAVYDSYNNGTATPWDAVGGTSFACPAWAALIAIADQGLVATGQGTLDGPNQTLPDLYQLYQTNPGDFHDITSGNNGGFSAGPGYDEVTGLGSPVANLLIPDLIGHSGLHVTPTLGAVSEGRPFANATVAVFTDPGALINPGSSYTATINWGDGSVTDGTVVAGSDGVSFAVTGSHTYGNPGAVTYSVAIQNTTTNAGGNGSARIIVNDAALAGAPRTIAAQVGGFVTNAFLGSFTDTDITPRPGSNYTASIVWSEGGGAIASAVGRVVAVGNGTFEVFGDNPFSYASSGALPIQVTVRDGGGAVAAWNSVASVTGNSAFASLFPIVGADRNLSGSLLQIMQNALANLITAERFFINAFLLGKAAAVEQAMPNLLHAFTQYEVAVLRYDLSLPL